MACSFHRTTALGVAAIAAVGLVGAGAGAAVGASGAHASLAPTPHLQVTMTKTKFTIAGPTTFKAGRVALSLTSTGKEHEVSVASLKKGYTFHDVRADLTAFGTKQGTGKNGSTPKSALKHLDRVVSNVNFYGGLDAVAGQTIRGTVVLPKPGTYIIVNDSGNLPSAPHKFIVTGPAVKRADPGATATVTALTARRFGGAKTLPAKGTITFKNKSTESPHFLALLHVKTGTTKADVLTALQSNGPPSFALPGQAGTDVVGEGQSQTLTYNLPKGEYVELCFFPDPKTGMPHAFMGMIGIVTLS
jgi:hypothetical protein